MSVATAGALALPSPATEEGSCDEAQSSEIDSNTSFSGRQPGAVAALVTLTCVNLLNFADRFVVSSVKELIKADMRLDDAQTALPMTSMAVVYMICAAIFGLLADRDVFDRRRILSVGILLWSAATALAGLAQDLGQLVLFRAFVGVGEAAYGVISGPLIVDLFPAEERTKAFAIYNLAMPVGGALGYGAGALIAEATSWRLAFAFAGLPGVALAFLVLCIANPPRGVNDEKRAQGERYSEGDAAEMKETSKGMFQDYLSLLQNSHYVVATLGLVAIVFAVGGLADWVASFLQRYDGASLAHAGLMVGALTAIGGVGGNILGAKTASYLERRIHSHSAAFLSSGLFCLPASVFAALAVNITGSEMRAYILLLVAQLNLWAYMSPIQNLSLSVVPLHLRASSAGLQIFFTHILGDVISPPIIGAISDSTGSLQVGMQLSWIAILVAGSFWLFGYACLRPVKLSDREIGERGASRSADSSSEES